MYLRKSRALGDPDDPALLAAHRSLLLRLAADDGHDGARIDIRQEIGSAERIDDRREFRALLEDWLRLPRGTGGIVYVTELARLTRGHVQDWARIEVALLNAGIKLRTRSRLFDLANPDDANIVDMEVLFGRVELRTNKRRLADKRREMARAGQVLTGRVPSFGYRWNFRDCKPEPDPATFPLLKEACREVLHTSIFKLARRYGIDRGTLRDTLHNPLICGWPVQRWLLHDPVRGYRDGGFRIDRSEWRWPENPGDYEAACTREEWLLIQRVLADRATRRAKTGDENGWCRDVVSFAGGVGAVRLSVWGDGHGRSVLTYETGSAEGPRLYVARDPVHAEAERALAELFRNPSVILAALDEYHGETTQTAPTARPELEIVRALKAERERLPALLTREADPNPEIRSAARIAVKDAVGSIERLKAEIQAAQALLAVRPRLEIAADEIATVARFWTAAFPSMPASMKRRISAACLEAIPVVITPRPGRRSWRREVLAARYADWLAPFMGE